LKGILVTNRHQGLFEVGDFGQLGHVLPNVTDDLRVIDTLIAQPAPNHHQLPV
jgi:hypothetical protein